MKNKLIILLLCVVVVVIVFVGMSTLPKVIREIRRLCEYGGYGKSFVIVIYDGEIIDYTKINNVRMGNGAPKQWFDKWTIKERVKLIEYMKENDLIIEPGKYKLNQFLYFEEVRDILKFRKKEAED